MKLKDFFKTKKRYFKKYKNIKIIANSIEYIIPEILLIQIIENNEVVYLNGEIVRVILKDEKSINYKIFFSFNRDLEESIIININENFKIKKIKAELIKKNLELTSEKYEYIYKYEGYDYGD